jgi:hypothetical protein
MHVCESCREQVDPKDPTIVHAFEVVQVGGFGQPGGEEGEGMGVLFHESCFDEEDPRYRRKP